MKTLKTLAVAAAVLAFAGGSTFAAETQKPAREVSFAHEGPFGSFDRGQLQRGYKVYKEVCAGCHSLNLISFRNLSEPGGPGFTDEQVKALAATFTVQDGPGEDGEMYDRPGLPSDKLPVPFPNEQAARAANGGALPPDLSLITKSRAGWYGTVNQFFNGIGGPEYVYSVLTGYEDPPAELAAEQPEGKAYNPYFAAGHWIGMPKPMEDGQVDYDDGTPNTLDQMSKDVSAFLAWTAEPKMEERKRLGFSTMAYLAVLALLLYLTKVKIWRDVH